APQERRACVRIAPSQPRFAAAILNVQELLARSGVADLADRYEYRLTASDGASGRAFVIARSSPLELDDPVAASFAVPQGRWTLEVVRRSGWRVRGAQTRGVAIVLHASLVFALFVYDLARRPYVLERE